VSTCTQLLSKAAPALLALDSLFETKPEKVRIDYLDLGAYESLAHSVLSDFVRQLRVEHPQVRFNMVVSRTSELLKKLRTGELCTALVAETDGMDRLKLEEVARDEMGLFLAKDLAHLAADWESIRTLGFGLISTSTDGIPAYLKSFLKQLGAKPKITLTSDSYEVLRRAAVHGLAAAVLPMRVGQRNQNDLIEIRKFNGAEKKNRGEHKIYLASMDRCDEKESVYLASVARDCFHRESKNLGALP
jgi:DNA-binding transcriptional LysR family regulator